MSDQRYFFCFPIFVPKNRIHSFWNKIPYDPKRFLSDRKIVFCWYKNFCFVLRNLWTYQGDSQPAHNHNILSYNAPTTLSCTLVRYVAFFWSTLYPSGYAVFSKAMRHSFEQSCILLSLDVPFWATAHPVSYILQPTEPRRTLRKYAAHFMLHSWNYAALLCELRYILLSYAAPSWPTLHPP